MRDFVKQKLRWVAWALLIGITLGLGAGWLIFPGDQSREHVIQETPSPDGKYLLRIFESEPPRFRSSPYWYRFSIVVADGGGDLVGTQFNFSMDSITLPKTVPKWNANQVEVEIQHYGVVVGTINDKQPPQTWQLVKSYLDLASSPKP